MTAGTAPTAALAVIQSAFTDSERLALAGFLAAYSGLTRDAGEAQRVREAAGVPLKAARLAVPMAGIGQRLTSDVTSGRREDLDEVGGIGQGPSGR